MVAFNTLPPKLLEVGALFAGSIGPLKPYPLHVPMGSHLAFTGGEVGLGIYTLLGGGILSFVGGCLRRK